VGPCQQLADGTRLRLVAGRSDPVFDQGGHRGLDERIRCWEVASRVVVHSEV
jgi:hypothetical protein